MQRQVVILAGGLGKRMYPTTKSIPKVLLPVMDCPFINWQLDLLDQNKIDKVIICVGFLGDQVEKMVGNKYRGIEIHYSYEQKNSLFGTAGAIKNAELLLEPFFGVLYGDSYLEIDYQSIFEAHTKSKFPATMVVWKNENKYDISNVSLSENKKRITSYKKGIKAKGFDYLDYGFSILNKEMIISRIKPKEFFDLSDLYSFLSSENLLGSFEVHKRFYEIGSKTGYQEFKNYIKKQFTKEYNTIK